MTILTNSKVGASMSDLELRARRGCPHAQRELRQRSMAFADAMMTDMRQGADMQDRKEMLQVK